MCLFPGVLLQSRLCMMLTGMACGITDVHVQQASENRSALQPHMIQTCKGATRQIRAHLRQSLLAGRAARSFEPRTQPSRQDQADQPPHRTHVACLQARTFCSVAGVVQSRTLVTVTVTLARHGIVVPLARTSKLAVLTVVTGIV